MTFKEWPAPVGPRPVDASAPTPGDPPSGVPLGVADTVEVDVPPGPGSSPVVNSVSPLSGPVGSVVTILGSNFTGTTAVNFGGVPASSFTVVSGSRITATVPAGAVTGLVSVTTGSGTGLSQNRFTVLAPPMLSIADVRMREGNTGARNAVFRVWLSTPGSAPVTVDYATTDGTALAGLDYVKTSGTLTFAPHARTQRIAVPVLGDTLHEGRETFTVTLSGATGGALIARGTGTGAIVDDDP